MSIDHDLDALLSAEAERIRDVEVDLVGIARQASLQRRRRRLLAVTAAAAAIAVVAGAAYGLARRGGDPAPVAPSPSPTRSVDGAPTEVPWLADGVLHLGAREISTNLRKLLYRGGATLLGASPAGDGPWEQVVDDSTRSLPTGPLRRDPVLSPDGSRAMWIRVVDDDTREVVMWDLGAHREIGSLEVGVDVQCCDQSGELEPVGVDASGRGYWTTGRTTLVWTPGADAVKVDRTLSPYDVDPWPGGAMVVGNTGGLPVIDPPGRYGSVSTNGRFRVEGEVAVGSGGLWSDDGAAYAFVAVGDGSASEKFADEPVSLWVQARGGEPRETDVVAPRVVAWEPSGTVVATAQDDAGGTSLWRCDVEAQCAQIQPLPRSATLPGDD